jgi:hypothetical protein
MLCALVSGSCSAGLQTLGKSKICRCHTRNILIMTMTVVGLEPVDS